MSEINKLPRGVMYVLGDKPMRLTIHDEETGDVLYQNVAHGGVMCSVEKYEILTDTAEVEGNQQYLMWGQPVVWMHAFVMLRNEIQKVIDQNPHFINQALAAAMWGNKKGDKMGE